jgi:hypothetical protein
MKSLSTRTALSAFAVALLATPSFAQNPHRQDQMSHFQGSSIDEVVLNGRVIGADPDPHIRSELMREHGSREGD